MSDTLLLNDLSPGKTFNQPSKVSCNCSQGDVKEIFQHLEKNDWKSLKEGNCLVVQVLVKLLMGKNKGDKKEAQVVNQMTCLPQCIDLVHKTLQNMKEILQKKIENIQEQKQNKVPENKSFDYSYREIEYNFQKKENISNSKNSLDQKCREQYYREYQNQNLLNQIQLKNQQVSQESQQKDEDAGKNSIKNSYYQYSEKYEEEISDEEQDENPLNQGIIDISQPSRSQYGNNSIYTSFNIDSPSVSENNSKINPAPLLLENQHRLQIKPRYWEYLLLLSKAQTQLTYLCQHMNWRLKFRQGLSKHDLERFSCITEVDIQHNERVSMFYGECFYANNKKEARHIASLFCLAQIYGKVQGAFEDFEIARNEKPTLQQPLLSDNRPILASRQFLFPPPQIKIQENHITQLSLAEYVKKVKSCKRELCNFISQNAKIFMNPKWNTCRPDYYGYWYIEGVVRYELDHKLLEYRYKTKNKSKKEAQRIVSKEILTQIYRDFPHLWKKYRKVKEEKGFD